ncbi:hypothetical protein B0A55_05385 [Friedmanniomyces simplex]|uniref:B-block binding subunit of TFIIIC domain-containing protein n=1 Tax=Friedmanniomyces simplex TaxID=329884 RepID=A0A4U0XBQ5_9PEZI|nr:hypothetical protein B0A55_05385 [Friedmanniomyces simplex]
MAWEWELELELEKLVERVVEAVAFCGTHGFDSAKLRELLVSYRIALLNNAPNDANFDANVVDEELLDAIRQRLEQHPDIEVRSGEHIEGRQREPRDSKNVDTVPPAHEAGTPRKRLFATKERMWHTITGHDPDKASVPQLEFDCLSVIAAHGPGGVVQGRLTRLTGQDKQSVPRRTDHLAAKGYILKTAVLDRGHETSLLRLKKFVEAARVSHDDPSRPVVTRDPRGNLSVDLAPLLAQTVDLMIQQPDHIMALQDLGWKGADRVLEDQATRIQVEPETDKWGFPPPSSHLFASNDGRASLKQSRPLPAAFDGPSNMERTSKTLSPRNGRRSSFIQQVRAPVKTAVLQPRPIIRPRITSENDHEEFESWAKVTAERIARAELHKQNAHMSASTSVADDESEPARKRRRIEHDEDDALDHRIADIEADILSRDRPGVYLNPPGAKDIKAQYFRQKGRPRNAQIVVVKGAWLKDLQWFKEDTAHVLAHLDEEFHHVGNGHTVSDSPGPAAKRLRSALQSGSGQTVGSAPEPQAVGTPGVEGGTGESQETTRRRSSRSAEVPLPDGIHHMIDTGSQGSAMDAPPASAPDFTPNPTNTEPTPKLFDNQYVLAHADEEFHHVGKGRWRRGPKPSKSKSEVTVMPSLGEPSVASTNTEPPSILFDKGSSKSRSEATVAPSPGLSGTAGATLTTGDASARSPETQPHEGQIAIAPDAASDTVQLVHNLEDVALKIDGSMVVEAAATAITGSEDQILPVVSPPQIPQTRSVEPVVGDLFPELADGTKEVAVGLP